jgi:hypothetical protein
MRRRKARQVKSKVFNYQVAARNRRASSNHWIHWLILLALVAVAVGIAYVWQRNRLVHMGYAVGQLRGEIKKLDDDRKKLEADIQKLREPGRIQRLVRDRGLGLGPPAAGQIVYLPEPAPLVGPDDDEPKRPLGERIWDAIVLGER